MKQNCTCLILLFILLLSCVVATAQSNDVKLFSKDGLMFDYPSNWQVEDRSDKDAQQLTLGRADSDAQIRVFVFRPLVGTPEKLAEAKKVLVDPYVNATMKQFEQMGVKPERMAATSEISALPAEGVKVQAILDGDPGAAEVYWAVVGQRLVVLTFFGPDKARKQTENAWNSIRSSLKVEQAKAEPAKKP